MDIEEVAVDFVLGPKIEGGYVNDPNDPGGETKYGISKRAYPNLDIKNLTVDQAKAIYQRDYWEAAGCDKLPPPLALLVFDAAVNMGVGAAKLLLAGPTPSLEEFCVRRIKRYTGMVGFPLYAHSWLTRTLLSYKLALSLVGASSNS